MTLTIAAAYGGREEIVDAVCKFLKAQAQQGASLPDVIKSLTSDAIGRHLYAADLPDPDLIIRTSGEIRLSGFLLWQSVHSEFYFTDVLWPAFLQNRLLTRHPRLPGTQPPLWPMSFGRAPKEIMGRRVSGN